MAVSGDEVTPTPITAEAAGNLRSVCVVLVRPQGAANIGAAARAMKNMGLRDLRLVGVSARRAAAALPVAVHARDVVEGARHCDTLAAAVADCGLVVGTTLRGGLYRRGAESPARLAPLIVAQAARAPVALVFGPETHGLTRDDLRCCQRLLTIDADPEYGSLNLAQAVLLCCYELRRSAAAEAESAAEGEQPAAAGEVLRLLDALESALLRIGFLNPQNPDPILFAIKDLLGRAVLRPYEVRVLLGLARQIEWYAGAAPDDDGGAAPAAKRDSSSPPRGRRRRTALDE